MSIKDIIVSSYQALLNWPKRKLVQAVQVLRQQYNEVLEKNKHLEEQNKALKEEISRLKEDIERQKIRSINEEANRPSSKQPEWCNLQNYFHTRSQE